MHVTSSRAWLALLACGLALAFAVVWGFLGSIAVTVSGRGLAAHPGGLHHVTVARDGTIAKLYVHAGDRVKAGEPIATEQTADGGGAVIRSEWAGTIDELTGGAGSYVRAGSPLARIDENSRTVEVIVFVANAQAHDLAPGMTAEIQPGGQASSRYGFIFGRVRSISHYPPSAQRLHYLLDNPQLEDALTGGAPVQEVHIDLESAPTPSGLRWSIAPGPPAALAAGTLCSANIIVRRERPIELLYPQG